MSQFKVMTFNVKGSYYEDGINNWENRAILNNESPWVYALHWGVTQGRGVNWVRLYDKETSSEFMHLTQYAPGP